MELQYATGGGKNKRYYSIKKMKDKKGNTYGKVSRISCKNYDDPKKNTTIGRIMPKVGDKVTIIIKPYKYYNCQTGIVKDVLTRRQFHSRGHKVRLANGTVGRTLKIH